MEYTYEAYRQILTDLIDRGYSFGKFADEITEGDVFVRHDIDWSPRKSLRLAEIENELGVTATYFVLLTSPFYNPLHHEIRSVLEELENLGHSIGVHFDTHEHWVSEPTNEEFVTELDQAISILDSIVNETTDAVSFHNPPEWIIGRNVGAYNSTYEHRFFENIGYVSDANGRWRGSEPVYNSPKNLQIVTHPVLWGEDDESTVERLREEQEHLFTMIDRYMIEMNDRWMGREDS